MNGSIAVAAQIVLQQLITVVLVVINIQPINNHGLNYVMQLHKLRQHYHVYVMENIIVVMQPNIGISIINYNRCNQFFFSIYLLIYFLFYTSVQLLSLFLVRVIRLELKLYLFYVKDAINEISKNHLAIFEVLPFQVTLLSYQNHCIRYQIYNE